MQNSIVKVSKCFNIFYTIFTQVLDKIENFEFPRNAQCLLSASLKWFWNSTSYSDFPTYHTFNPFYDLDTSLTFAELRAVSMEHLEREWHASRERLSVRTPGSALFGTCLCSNAMVDQFSLTCRIFSRVFIFILNIPRYFLDFAFEQKFWVWPEELPKCFRSLLYQGKIRKF